MKWAWFQSISQDELDIARAAMATNMVAGDTLAIPTWRYSLIGSILYSIARAAAYCIRHSRERGVALCPDLPVYIYFTPTSENAARQVEARHRGTALGFKGKYCFNFPMRKMLAATFFAFKSQAIWRWILSDRCWRPWMSDVIFYILTARWASERFRQSQPLVLIYSNDHCCFDRGIADAAVGLGHTTIYIQHAPVTDIFPPLSAHYSLLDGKQALLTYAAIEGSKGTALICGRQYEIAAIRHRRTHSRSTLICTSTIDSLESWKHVMASIRSAGYIIALRTHPSERRKGAWQRLAQEMGVTWLDPLETNLATALEEYSFVLAGQSGVLLEAAISGAASIIIQFPEDTALGLHDYYGFGSAGLAHLLHPDEVTDFFSKLAHGEAASNQLDASYFDLACALEENMLLTAVSTILEGRGEHDGLLAAGFRPELSPEPGSLNVFVPTALRTVAGPASAQ